MIAHYLVFNKERNIILTHFQDLRYFIGLEQFDLFNNLTLDVNKMRFNQNNINWTNIGIKIDTQDEN